MNPVPFPHLVLDGLWPDVLIHEAKTEMLRMHAEHVARWHRFDNEHERKLVMSYATARELGAEAVCELGRMLAHPVWIEELEAHTGITSLSYDEHYGSPSLIELGGHLDVHVDFNRHEDGRYRRVNVLLYLNDTHPTGDLQLWADGESGPAVRIETAANRTAVFLTSERSWHGHPDPLRGRVERCSLAAYYFTPWPPEGCAPPHSTIFLGD